MTIFSCKAQIEQLYSLIFDFSYIYMGCDNYEFFDIIVYCDR